MVSLVLLNKMHSQPQAQLRTVCMSESGDEYCLSLGELPVSARIRCMLHTEEAYDGGAEDIPDPTRPSGQDLKGISDMTVLLKVDVNQ